jgi:hypothetical protein
MSVKALMQQLIHKGSTTDPTDAIVDVRFDPTGKTYTYSDIYAHTSFVFHVYCSFCMNVHIFHEI